MPIIKSFIECLHLRGEDCGDMRKKCPFEDGVTLKLRPPCTSQGATVHILCPKPVNTDSSDTRDRALRGVCERHKAREGRE